SLGGNRQAKFTVFSGVPALAGLIEIPSGARPTDQDIVGTLSSPWSNRALGCPPASAANRSENVQRMGLEKNMGYPTIQPS
ncbi:MAG: hypothetical protein ACK53L_02760, partial [Pirellulaceae bacterium]